MASITRRRVSSRELRGTRVPGSLAINPLSQISIEKSTLSPVVKFLLSMSRFVEDVRRAVARGDLPQCFRPDDVRRACPGWANHTYGVFLPKHRHGNPGGYTEYFLQNPDGSYSLTAELYGRALAAIRTGWRVPTRLSLLRRVQVVVDHCGEPSRRSPRFSATPSANPGYLTRQSAAPQERTDPPLSPVPARGAGLPQSTPGPGQYQPAAARSADRPASQVPAPRRPGRRRGRWPRDPYRESTAAIHPCRDAHRPQARKPLSAPKASEVGRWRGTCWAGPFPAPSSRTNACAFQRTWLSGDFSVDVAAGCPVWMVSWQGWQTGRVLRRRLAMSSAHPGCGCPGFARSASLRTW